MRRASPSDVIKMGGIVMQYVTYSELLGLAMLIVGIITLVFTILMYTHKK